MYIPEEDCKHFNVCSSCSHFSSCQIIRQPSKMAKLNEIKREDRCFSCKKAKVCYYNTACKGAK